MRAQIHSRRLVQHVFPQVRALPIRDVLFHSLGKSAHVLVAGSRRRGGTNGGARVKGQGPDVRVHSRGTLVEAFDLGGKFPAVARHRVSLRQSQVGLGRLLKERLYFRGIDE